MPGVRFCLSNHLPNDPAVHIRTQETAMRIHVLGTIYWSVVVHVVVIRFKRKGQRIRSRLCEELQHPPRLGWHAVCQVVVLARVIVDVEEHGGCVKDASIDLAVGLDVGF